MVLSHYNSQTAEEGEMGELRRSRAAWLPACGPVSTASKQADAAGQDEGAGRERGLMIEDDFDILFRWVSVQTATDGQVIF
jgi:hypothetical protein